MHSQLDEIQWAKVVTEAWINPDFKASLERAPGSTVREFARAQFGIDIDPEIDSFALPEAPTDMFGEELSSHGSVSGTVTCCATAGGNVSGTVTCCATAGGNVSGTVTCCATAGGNVR
jgi:hypothetical protein